MDTQKIKVILSAVKYKSLSKAAEEISYTPSAMSHIADSLENELGVKILERTPLGISLTEEGKELYQYMEALLEAEKNLLQSAKALAKSREYHLRIGSFSSISQNILPEIISQFRKIHPDIRISVSVDDRLLNWLDNNVVDIIFTDDHSMGSNMWIPIKKDPFVAVVRSSEFKGKKYISKEELYGLTYISTNEDVLEGYFDKSRFENVIDYESIDNVSVLYMVQQGLGFSVLPSLMLSQKMKGVKAVGLRPKVSRTIGFAFKKDAKLTYAAKTFIDFLQSGRKSVL
ncbi:MAG: LysR family transcriptional regulator [Clostridia bacterium]|nr:LysR family transcriptional regulator [Clostridia bacterium]